MSYLLTFLLVATTAGETPRIQIPFIDAPPTIDGDLSDVVWQIATPIDTFKVSGTEKEASVRTVVRLLCDGKNLYAAFDCDEPEIERVKEAMKSVKAASWDADLVEFHFDIPHGDPGYRECMVNPNGMGVAGFVLDETAAKEFHSAAVYHESSWTAECAFPLRAYGIEQLQTQVVWGANIRRFRTYFDPQLDESYQWAGTPFGIRDSAHYGEWVLGPDTGLIVESLRFQSQGIGAGNPAIVRFVNQGKTRSLSIATQNLETKVEERISFQVVKGLSEKIASLTLDSTPTEQKVCLSIVDDQTQQVLYQRRDTAIIPPALYVEFSSPAYRGDIFPETKEVSGAAHLGQTQRSLTNAQLEIAGIHQSRILFTQRIPINSATVSFQLAVEQFGEGENELHLAAVNPQGKTLAAATLPIRKYEKAGVARIPARIDENLRLVVDGESFFPLGWYSGGNPDHLREIAEAGVFNCILDYGINNKGFDEILNYLDLAESLKMKVIYCNNDLYPSATYIPKKSVWSGNREIAETTVRAFRNHPAVITWYLNDELPVSLVPDLIEYNNLFRKLAPNQPTLMVHYTPQVFAEMGKTIDVLGMDHYPVPRSPLTEVSDFIDAGYDAVHGLKPVWMVLQAFGWYQYRDPETPVQGNPRARIPTSAELDLGRAPTRDEVRCMTYLSLTHNAKGLLYYCYYDTRVLPQYAEMWKWLKEIGAEVKCLFPVLLSADTISSQCGDSRIHHLARRVNDSVTVMAVNGVQESNPATLALDGIYEGKAEVLFENREVTVEQGKITDTFGPLEAHIYRLKSK